MIKNGKLHAYEGLLIMPVYWLSNHLKMFWDRNRIDGKKFLKISSKNQAKNALVVSFSEAEMDEMAGRSDDQKTDGFEGVSEPLGTLALERQIAAQNANLEARISGLELLLKEFLKKQE